MKLLYRLFMYFDLGRLLVDTKNTSLKEVPKVRSA